MRWSRGVASCGTSCQACSPGWTAVLGGAQLDANHALIAPIGGNEIFRHADMVMFPIPTGLRAWTRTREAVTQARAGPGIGQIHDD